MVHKHEKGSGSVAKRLLGLCLALVMLCGVFVPTFASVAGGEDQPTGTEQTAEPTGGTDGKQDTEGQPTGGAEDVNAGDDGEKKDDAGNVSGDAKDESENTGDSTGDTKDENTGDGETKDEAKDESEDGAKDANADEDVKDADEPEDAADDVVAANGIATYANVGTVTTGIANNSNIQVHMFNYTGAINDAKETQSTKLYFFNDKRNTPALDDKTDKLDEDDQYQSKNMQKTLGTDGYPVYNKNSLKYLFDTNPSGNINGFIHYKAEANSGLFKNAENGYLEYDSGKNAAYFNISGDKEGTFTLYDGVVRPGHETRTGIPQGTNFLPFNNSSQFIKDENCSHTPQRYTLEWGKVDLWFGMTVEFDFLMPKDGKISGQPMKFEFEGDDDVWVFIDDVLVLDIGGTHGAETGTIDFASGKCDSTKLKNTTLKQLFNNAKKSTTEADWDGNTFADYTTHKLKFFYLERGGNISYCKLRFNIQTLPEKSLTIGKELTTDANVALTNYLKQTYTYKFRVLKAGTSELYVPKNTEYTLVDSRNYEPLLDANGNPRTGKVDENGYIYLKAGEYAQFTNMAQYGGANGPYDYVVEETLPNNLTGQYGQVEYAIGAGTGKETTENKNEKDFTGYRTGTLSALLSQIIVYNNQVATKEMGQLTIKKVVTGTENSTDDFTMEVTLGGKLLAVGTKYKIGTEEKTVAEEGKITLKADETAVIENILAGTEFTVKEVGLVNNDSYKFECEKVEASQVVKDGENKGQNVGTAEVDETTKVASGTVGVNGAVSIVVTNKYTPKTTTVTVKKIVAGLLGDKDKTFHFTWEYTVNGVTTKDSFDLKNYDSEDATTVKVIENVPIDATVIIKETNGTGYVTSWVVSNDEATKGNGTDASFTANADTTKNTITFTNTKDADPDTGVFLDSMPYIMALVIVAGGAAVFFLRRRKKSED